MKRVLADRHRPELRERAAVLERRGRAQTGQHERDRDQEDHDQHDHDRVPEAVVAAAAPTAAAASGRRTFEPVRASLDHATPASGCGWYRSGVRRSASSRGIRPPLFDGRRLESSDRPAAGEAVLEAVPEARRRPRPAASRGARARPRGPRESRRARSRCPSRPRPAPGPPRARGRDRRPPLRPPRASAPSSAGWIPPPLPEMCRTASSRRSSAASSSSSASTIRRTSGRTAPSASFASAGVKVRSATGL